jgi:uncharacterized metal-binding protein YceD (DUF177 family)
MTTIPVEFSRVASLELLTKRVDSLAMKATPVECEALAKRFHIVSIDFFEAEVSVKWRGGKSINYDVTGRLKARLTQSCIVTLQDIVENIDGTFDFRVVHPKQMEELTEELDEFQDIEFSEDDNVDLGEIAAQYLALSMDPYPRLKETAELSILTPSTPKKNPFAALASLKKDK